MISGTGDAYLDLANTYLLIRAKVVQGVGTELAADTPVAPVNTWPHSLFSQVDVYLNDTLVTPSSNTYPFRSYVDTVLRYGDEAKNMHLGRFRLSINLAGARGCHLARTFLPGAGMLSCNCPKTTTQIGGI